MAVNSDQTILFNVFLLIEPLRTNAPNDYIKIESLVFSPVYGNHFITFIYLITGASLRIQLFPIRVVRYFRQTWAKSGAALQMPLSNNPFIDKISLCEKLYFVLN